MLRRGGLATADTSMEPVHVEIKAWALKCIDDYLVWSAGDVSSR